MSKVEQESVERLLYSRREAAEMLGLCVQTIDNLLHSGALAYVWMGSRKLIKADDLREFAQAGHPSRIRP